MRVSGCGGSGQCFRQPPDCRLGRIRRGNRWDGERSGRSSLLWSHSGGELWKMFLVMQCITVHSLWETKRNNNGWLCRSTKKQEYSWWGCNILFSSSLFVLFRDTQRYYSSCAICLISVTKCPNAQSILILNITIIAQSKSHFQCMCNVSTQRVGCRKSRNNKQNDKERESVSWCQWYQRPGTNRGEKRETEKAAGGTHNSPQCPNAERGREKGDTMQYSLWN